MTPREEQQIRIVRQRMAEQGAAFVGAREMDIVLRKVDELERQVGQSR